MCQLLEKAAVSTIIIITSSIPAGGSVTLCSPLCGSRVLLWGPAAVEHHKTCRSLGKSLWQQPSVGDILRLLDRDRMMKTILHFPQNRRLLPPEVQEAQGRASGSSHSGASLRGLCLHPQL